MAGVKIQEAVYVHLVRAISSSAQHNDGGVFGNRYAGKGSCLRMERFLLKARVKSSDSVCK